MNTSYLAGLIFVLSFAGLVLIHEFGHFLAARLFGIEVEEFGVGLPPRGLRFWRAKGSLIVGQHTIEIPKNFDLPFEPESGLDHGFEVVMKRVNEKLVLESIRLADTEDGQYRPAQAEPVQGVDGKWRMDGVLHKLVQGTEFTLNWLPLGGFVRPKGENDPNVLGGLAAASPWKRLGVLFAGPTMNLLAGLLVFAFLVRMDGYHDYTHVQLAEISPNSPAQQAGLQPGDLITMAGGQTINNPDTLRQVVSSHVGQPVEFVIQRGGQTFTVTATPRLNPPQGQGALGIVMSEVIVPVHSWGDTIHYAFVSVYDQIHSILLLPAQMMRGTLAPGDGRFIGLKGIFDIFNVTVSTDVASREATTTSVPQAPTYSTLYLIATLTISIGLLNLFPFPALDGGRIIFVLPELLTRRRVPPQFENTVHAVGMVILLLFMLYINVMDFVNPLQLKP